VKILLHDRTGVHFTVQLARKLANRGYDVLYSYAAFFQSPKGSLERNETDPENFCIISMELKKEFNKYSYVRRYFQEIEYANDLVNQIRQYQPDILLIAGSHPDAISVVFRKCWRMEMKKIFWVQDIYSLAIKKIFKKWNRLLGEIIGNYYISKESKLLKKSDDVILITEDFAPLMKEWNIPTEKLHVIYNWAPLDEISVLQKKNAWSREHDLDNKFCYLYSGTLGLKHNPNLLLELAIKFQDNNDVMIVVISEGIGADMLRDHQSKHNLTNLRIIDFQPFDRLREVLATADILVGILEPEAGVYSAPSKVLTYMCAKRPLLLAIPKENISARIVLETNSGIVVSPSNKDEFISAAEHLFNEDYLRTIYAKNARKYAEDRFNIDSICDQFEKIMKNTVKSNEQMNI